MDKFRAYVFLIENNTLYLPDLIPFEKSLFIFNFDWFEKKDSVLVGLEFLNEIFPEDPESEFIVNIVTERWLQQMNDVYHVSNFLEIFKKKKHLIYMFLKQAIQTLNMNTHERQVIHLSSDYDEEHPSLANLCPFLFQNERDGPGDEEPIFFSLLKKYNTQNNTN